ncbi:hypothetical protein EK21DRAFT_106870 [Setomelanomma holmii]|uniref:BTB domain-containing protein n=1 Tax=Setomelanomma holmii TaxID=210430 RepID=A0A9P4HKS1_9PLEO|nr:hypothetical protein EK21DRAFT_106870 [Setomelanomma holmii]
MARQSDELSCGSNDLVDASSAQDIHHIIQRHRQSRGVEKLQRRISAPNPAFTTIVVGPDGVRFVVHEALLVYHSDFFRAALTGHFKEATDKTIKLVEDDPGYFEIFVHWLYHQRFPDKARNDAMELVQFYLDHGQMYAEAFSIGALVSLYVIGDKYQIRGLRLDAINEISRQVCEPRTVPLPHEIDIAYVFEHLHPETPLCRFISDAVCYHESPTTYDSKTIDSLPFLRSIWRRYAVLVHDDCGHGADPGAYKLRLCDYHEHADDVEKEACQNVRSTKGKRVREAIRS